MVRLLCFTNTLEYKACELYDINIIGTGKFTQTIFQRDSVSISLWTASCGECKLGLVSILAHVSNLSTDHNG